MKELGEALKAIFDKVGQFLDLFDLSFFIAGGAGAGAGWTWLHCSHRLPTVQLVGWVQVLAVVVGIYASGLVCFCIGRCFRTIGRAACSKVRGKTTHSSFDNCFLASLRGHQLDAVEPFRSYLAIQPPMARGIWALYVRLWADLRSDPKMATSVSLGNRYWVMAATYDGLAFAILIWGAVAASFTFGWGAPAMLELSVGLFATVSSVFAAWGCLREAARYAEYQIYELVAATAARLNTPKFPAAGIL